MQSCEDIRLLCGAAIPFPVFPRMTVMPIFRRKHRNVLSEALYQQRCALLETVVLPVSWDFLKSLQTKSRFLRFSMGKIVPM